MAATRTTDSRPAIWACRLLIAGFLGLVALQFFTRKTADWEVVYLSAANHLRAHGDVFDGTNGYTYPPFGALFAVPFTLVPPLAGTVAFASLNVLCAVVVFVGAWRLAGGRGLPGRAGTGAVDVAAFWLGALLVVGFVLDTAANRQTDLVIAAIVVTGGLLLARGRSIPAGLAFGLAAAFKCTPLLFAPYLAWKRRFVAAGAVVAAAVGLNLLPDVAYPPADGKARLALWKDRFLAPMSDANRDPGQWASAVGFNHSLAGINLRLLAYERTGDPALPVAPKAERPTARELKLINLGCVALMGVVALAAFWRKSGVVEAGPALAAELGVVCALMLMLSPMSSKPHFTPLLLAQLVIVRVGFARRDRVLIGLAALVAAGGLCTGKDIVGKTVYEFLMWNGLLFGLTLALFLGCCRARVLANRAGQAGGAAPAAVVTGVRRAA
ncbi:---NA--- : Uncharacterized protein OS=Bradyrhizobium sp. WSM1253 GN=Bra1253DRAFT_02096 PE=4 SV=1: DUF2029 [Gemmataceae bacterium]|nr:---NA--- : Uncharacterized protein OS=Bradyrhizobium sp. WSM1253 GN=Bra1253DRAFT_02096 PE=4 SV=1: DUF2029 [Gemmataceae bacterium]VTU00840.1 ---NA--- : Uncharacterized protein OS=Bradyrhizobium sp. WSM1253 GN=Bra1253DRAFT_02096 PE=4 SV=1: DUF2029 [Gemmataceae bacterium]